MNTHNTPTRREFLFLAISLLLLPFVLRAQSTEVPLSLGDALPDISGRTPAGNTLHLSEGVQGKKGIIVFSFSKAAGKDARLWSDLLSKDYDSDGSVAVITVLMLEAVPRLFRGMIVSELRGSMSARMQNNTILCYQDEDLWKHRLAVVDDGQPVVLLLGPEDRIRWKRSGGFTDVGYRDLKRALQ